jgi:hypothetical protein
MRRKIIDHELLTIAILSVVASDRYNVDAEKVWTKVHTDPTYVNLALANPRVATLYTRLQLPLDRRQLLDLGQWT